MKEKLLALLISKFAGVSEATLDRIATKRAGSVTDESQLQSIVDGIDFGFVVNSEVDSKVTLANQKAIQNYEATHKLKEGKPVSTDPANPPAPAQDVPEWAKAIIETNNALKSKLEGYEKKETQSVLSQKVMDKLYAGKNDNQKFVLDVMLGGNPINIESEDQIDSVVTAYSDRFTQTYQKAVEKNVVIDIPAQSSGGEGDFASKMKAINEVKP